MAPMMTTIRTAEGALLWRDEASGRTFPILAGADPVTDSIITRSDVEARIPEAVAREVIQQMPEQSAAFQLFRRIPMSDRQQRLPVLAALPVAYFVSGDTGLKQTTQMAWDKKQLIVEEIACIVPMPEAVLDDSSFDIWAEARPRLVEAIGRTADAAILFGVDKPNTWPASVVQMAVAASNTVTRGTAAQGAGGIAEDINQLMGKVEDDGFDVNGFATDRRFRKYLRGARATDGQKLLDVSQGTLEGEPVAYTARGLWPSAAGGAEMIAGDWTQGILGVRQDITWKLADQGVIQDGSGAIVYNLFQQDMVALRVVMRIAWQVANPVTYENPNDATRAPFSVLLKP